MEVWRTDFDLLESIVRMDRAEYEVSAIACEAAMAQVHKSGHGSPEVISGLQRANRLGQIAVTALDRYHQSAARLAAYAGHPSSPAHPRLAKKISHRQP